MTAEGYSSIIDWLYEGVYDEYEKSSVKEYAEKAFKPLRGVIAQLWAIFDNQVKNSKDKWIRYADGNIYVYTGKWFERLDSMPDFGEIVRGVLTKLGVNDTFRLYGADKIASTLAVGLRTTPGCAYKPSRRWICFPNGVLDLKKGEFREKFSTNYCTDIIMDFDYNPRVGRILWDTKLKQIIPNPGLRNDFQQFCGSLLSDRSEYKSEYICYLYGGGGNGKSVLANTIARTFGERYYSTFTLNQIFAKETAAVFVVKEMSGKLLNLCDDVEDKDVSGANFKRFVSGDPMPGRGVGKGDWTQVTPPMLLCCINTFPDVADDSEGNHRRQLIVETTRTQWQGDDRDTNLAAKLSTTESRQAVFNWIYEGYRKLRSNKGDIKLSKEGMDARKLRKSESSPMRRWAKDRGYVKAVPGGNSDPRWYRLSAMFADYKQYCVDNGYRFETDSRKIAAMFRSAGCAVKNMCGKGTMACVGILGKDTNADGSYIEPEIEGYEEEDLGYDTL